MKILQIFGAVVAVHLLAFIFIFASPGCQSGPRNVPTPDATLPSDSASVAPITYNANATPQPVDLGTAPASGHASPTRPGSPAAAVVSPSRANDDVATVTTYTVAKGDSLWSVAKKNHLSVSELAKANSIPTGAALKPGQKLFVPVKAGANAPVKEAPISLTSAKPATTPAATTEGVKHTVRAGESLGVIAKKYQVSVGELVAVNNISDPSKVRAGQQLIIPGGKTVKSAPVAGRPATTTKPAATTPAATGPVPSATTPAATTPAASPRFEITAPPPGQDLDAGLKEATTEVPTIKVEESTSEPSK